MLHLTAEQEMLRNTIRDFVRRECDWERDRLMDAEEAFPDYYHRKLADMGLIALPIPEEYGGAGGSIVDVALITEELARGGRSLSGSISHDIFVGALQIGKCGNEEQKRELLPPIGQGTLRCAIAMTEPDAGSDVASLKTQAHLQGDNYVLNGSKIYISIADSSDYLLTLVRTDPSLPKHRGLSLFIVPRLAPGVTVSRLAKLGQRWASACEIHFDDVVIPAERIIGGAAAVNQGWRQILSILEDERIIMSATCTGQAQRALDLAVDYATKRVQFGRPIGAFQAIQHMLADMATNLLAARLLTFHVARLRERGLPCAQEASMAKLFCSETCKKAALDGLQIMGGSGYMMENPMQQLVRDSLLDTIAGGTSQIQRNIIARRLGLPES